VHAGTIALVNKRAVDQRNGDKDQQSGEPKPAQAKENNNKPKEDWIVLPGVTNSSGLHEAFRTCSP
jgi:hypothetical protein